MKLASALAAVAAFASSATALTAAVNLTTKSTNKAVDGFGLYGWHEGAAINYLVLWGESEEFTYVSANSTIFDTAIYPGFQFNLQIWDPFLVVSPGIDPVTAWSFNADGVLEANGSTAGFYAAKDLNDPYNYSASNYLAAYYADAKDAPAGAIPIEIVGVGLPGSAAASTTSAYNSTVTAYPNSTSVPAAVSTGYANSTAPFANLTSTAGSATATKPAPSTATTNGASLVSGSLLAVLGAVVFSIVL